MLNEAELESKLFPLTKEEKRLYKQGMRIKSASQLERFDERLFFEGEKLSIRQHPRYSNVPLHSHAYIECIYVYRGQCRQLIEGKEVELTAGDFCILDKKVSHRILDTSESDVIINFLLHEDYFTHTFFYRLINQGVTTQFLAEVIYKEENIGSCLIFRTAKSTRLRSIITTILCEYFQKDAYSDSILEAYMSILFNELLRDDQYEWICSKRLVTTQPILVEVLNYIADCSGTCTLKETAQEFHFSSSYLSTLIKKETGSTFSELVKETRLRKAYDLLMYTDESIDQIAVKVGYQNRSFFYKLFKSHYKMTPNELRKKA